MIEGLKFTITGVRIMEIIGERRHALEERLTHYRGVEKKMKRSEDAEYDSPVASVKRRLQKIEKSLAWVRMLAACVDEKETYLLTEEDLKGLTNVGDYRRG